MTADPGGPVLPGGRPAVPALGRDDVVAEVVAELRSGRRVVLEGPAGIGKTTMLGTVLARLREAGTTVLVGAPSEAEQQLSYAALADVLQPLKRYVDRLPAPQRAALVAVLSDRDPTDRVDERALGAAVLALLATASRRPLVLAVDDAMWLDDASARALTFALRRVAVPVVACVRTTAPVPLGIEREAHVVTVDPLTEPSVCEMLEERLAPRVPRATIQRIAHESGGNPLLAWELSRAVLRLPRPPGPHDDLPLVDTSITGLTAATLDDLPAPATAALRLAALLTVPRPADLIAAGARIADLDPAVAARIVTVGPHRIAFTHPTYATAVRAALAPGERRALHEVLAGAVADPDERARQLARARVDPDADVAAEIAASAERLRTRGAPRAAAGLFQQAAALTPVGAPDRPDRVLAAARCLFDAYDLREAADLCHEVLGPATAGTRAEALLLLASITWYDESLDHRSPYELASEARAAAPPDTALVGRILSHLAIFGSDPAVAADHASAAAAIFEGLPEERERLASSLLAVFLAEARAGRPPRDDLVERALALEGDTPLWESGTNPAIWWITLDETDRALARLDWMLRHATARGDEAWALEIGAHVVGAELLAGRLGQAADHLARLRQGAESSAVQATEDVVLLAELQLRRGDLAAAREAVAGRATSEPWFSWHLALLRARLDIAAGRSADAARAFAGVAAGLDAARVVEGQWQRFEPEWVEALCDVGDLVGARSVLARLDARHARLPRPWTRLGLARARVLLARASDGDVALAVDEVRAALDEVPPDAVLLDRGHAALVGARATLATGDAEGARALFDVARRAYAAAGASPREAAASDELAAVSSLAPDADDVRKVLRDFHRPARLAASPFGSSAAEVQQLVRGGIAQTFGDSAEERLLADVLEAAYLVPGASHAAAMRALHLSRTTYYRRLAEATERLATWVLERPRGA